MTTACTHLPTGSWNDMSHTDRIHLLARGIQTNPQTTDEDITELLTYIAALTRALDAYRIATVNEAQTRGITWARIGAALGIHRAAAHDHWKKNR